MPERLSSLDPGYTAGDLSIYPQGIDNRSTLYEARNNAETTLKQSLAFGSRAIIVHDASKFPPQGLLRIGTPGRSDNYELIYYGSRTQATFSDLVRGFAGSVRNRWPANSSVANGVMAEHHNAIKDALLQLERNIGLSGGGVEQPSPESLSGILRGLEVRFLAPKPTFRAFPLKGKPPLKVRFQNFSGGSPIRYLWDFGDGSSSTESSPIHTFTREGIYTVKLNVITTLGAQGIVIKNNYISVNEDSDTPFFYVNPMIGDSIQTSGSNATVFEFTDQTDGAIVRRIWSFGDGERAEINDPDIHSVSYSYNTPGTYNPRLLIEYEDTLLKRGDIIESIMVR